MVGPLHGSAKASEMRGLRAGPGLSVSRDFSRNPTFSREKKLGFGFFFSFSSLFPLPDFSLRFPF